MQERTVRIHKRGLFYALIVRKKGHTHLKGQTAYDDLMKWSHQRIIINAYEERRVLSSSGWSTTYARIYLAVMMNISFLALSEFP